MKKIIALTVIVFSMVALWAQSGDPLRLEIPTRTGTDPFNYVTAGKSGVCVFYPTISEAGKDSVSWSFVMTDDKLKETWRKQVPLHEDVTYLKGFSYNNGIYLLFHDTKRNKESNLFVFIIIPRLQVITEHRGMIPDKAEVVDFELADDYVLVGYNNRKGQPGIAGFSLVTGEKRNFDITSEKDALLLDIAVDTLQKEVYAAYKVQSSSIKNHLYLNRYNWYGGVTSTIDFANQQERRNVNSAQYVSLGAGKGLITGTYGYSQTNSRRPYNYYDNYYNYYYNYYSPYYNRPSEYDANDDNSPVSDGYFTAVYSNGIAGETSYYNFGGFNNAVRYITDESALRIKMRSEKKNNRDDKKLSEDNDNDKENSLNLRLLTHEVVTNHGEYVVMSEAYSPEYHTVSRMSYDYYGRAFPTTYQVFDGFRYSHAFVAAFDSNGKMRWNNGMEMRDILSKYLNRKLNCLFDGEETILYYNANNKIAFKTIKGSEILENTTYTTLSPKRGTDQPVEEYLGTIAHWYDDYFIATGYQTIRNNYLESNKRNVFYINKLAFR